MFKPKNSDDPVALCSMCQIAVLLGVGEGYPTTSLTKPLGHTSIYNGQVASYSGAGKGNLRGLYFVDRRFVQHIINYISHSYTMF